MSQAPREIPGFYWDPETKRYYRVTKDHPGLAASSSSVTRPEPGRSPVQGESGPSRKRARVAPRYQVPLTARRGSQRASLWVGTQGDRAVPAGLPLPRLTGLRELLGRQVGTQWDQSVFRHALLQPPPPPQEAIVVVDRVEKRAHGRRCVQEPASDAHGVEKVALDRVVWSVPCAVQGRSPRATFDRTTGCLFFSDAASVRAVRLRDLAHTPTIDHAAVGHFDSDIVALETLHDARMLLVGLLGGHRSSGRVHLCGIRAHGQLALNQPKPFATITLRNMSCWTATAHPTSTAAGLDVAIGSTRTVQVSHIDPTGRALPTAVLTTLSDPLALHWSYDHPDLLYVGQRDGFVHLVDVRVPSVRTHLARTAVASIPPSVPVVPDTVRTRGWIAQPTVPASPVSAFQSHGSDVYALHRDGSLRAQLPGHGAIEVVRPCPGAERGETLLYPLGMATTPMGVVAAQPMGEPWVRVAGQQVVQVIGDGAHGMGTGVAACPDVVAVPREAVSRDAFERMTAPDDDVLDEFCSSVVGVHSNGFVFAQ